MLRPKLFHLENQWVGCYTCPNERPLVWLYFLYGRIYVDFPFLTVHKVCTKARLLGERSVRIREVKGSNPSRSTFSSSVILSLLLFFCIHISHALALGPRGIRTARPCRRQGKHFALLQFHLAAVFSCHAFNIQSVRIRASCAAVSKTFGAASHQHQPGSQNYKQEKRDRPYFLFLCRVSYSLSSYLKIASALLYETSALRPA